MGSPALGSDHCLHITKRLKSSRSDSQEEKADTHNNKLHFTVKVLQGRYGMSRACQAQRENLNDHGGLNDEASVRN